MKELNRNILQMSMKWKASTAQPQPQIACPVGICQGDEQEWVPLLGFSECGHLVSCGDYGTVSEER